jgi:pilus assembly protein Flp/PilA
MKLHPHRRRPARRRDERGATAVEYGLMVALIAVAIVTAVGMFGGAVQHLFELIPPAVWEG